MYSERRDASEGDVASWLERVGARLRELEAENARLKQELADLRSGAGIALMIDGHIMPLALQAPADPTPTGRMPTRQSAAPANQPRQQAAHLPPGLAPLTGHVPTPTPAAAPPQQVLSASHPSFGPLAFTPEELPAVRGLVPASRPPARDWLGAGDAWPDATAPARRGRPAATLRTAVTPARGTYPPARPRATSDPLWSERGRANGERNPYADSFIL